MFHDLSGKAGSPAPALITSSDFGPWTLDIGL